MSRMTKRVLGVLIVAAAVVIDLWLLQTLDTGGAIAAGLGIGVLAGVLLSALGIFSSGKNAKDES